MSIPSTLSMAMGYCYPPSLSSVPSDSSHDGKKSRSHFSVILLCRRGAFSFLCSRNSEFKLGHSLVVLVSIYCFWYQIRAYHCWDTNDMVKFYACFEADVEVEMEGMARLGFCSKTPLLLDVMKLEGCCFLSSVPVLLA
jgi:hypothetical protein